MQVDRDTGGYGIATSNPTDYLLKINQQASVPASVARDGVSVRASSAATFDTDSESWYYDATAKAVWVRFHLSSSVGTKVSL